MSLSRRYDDWKADDERDLSGPPPRSPEQTFRHNWRYLLRKGNRQAMEDFLEFHAAFPMLFGALVAECREQMAEERTQVLVRLDIEAGERVEAE